MRVSMATLVYILTFAPLWSEPASAAPAAAPAAPATAKVCDDYVPTGAAQTLVRGARSQVILLWPPGGCRNLLTEFKNERTKAAFASSASVLLTDDKDPDNTLSALLEGDSRLVFEYIPPELTKAKYRFAITRSETGASLGFVDLTVGSISARTPLHVTYEDQQLDRLQDGNGTKIADRTIAVVSGHSSSSVLNTVLLDIPAALPNVSGTDSYWEIGSSSWKSAEFISTRQGSSVGFDAIARPTQLSFTVAEAEATPLRVVLQLRQRSSDRGDPIWFSVDVELAQEARHESVALPIARSSQIQCTRGRWYSPVDQNGVMAIEDDALETASCFLLIRSTHLREYGPQAIEVTVSRDKAKPRTVIWDASDDSNVEQCPKFDYYVLDAARRPALRQEDSACLPLFPPDDNGSGEGVYSIDARLAPSAPQAVYRSGAFKVILDGSTKTQDFSFSARLRPRGRFATGHNYRLFVTVPVDLFAMRFPATIRNVDRSSAGSAVELTTLRAGIHFVIEPWDYARAKNSWTVPMQGVLGVGLFDIANAQKALSFVVGTKAVLGTVGDKLSASVTVGMYYELDLIDPRRGSHFLVSTDISFLSLFGAQSSGQ